MDDECLSGKTWKNTSGIGTSKPAKWHCIDCAMLKLIHVLEGYDSNSMDCHNINKLRYKIKISQSIIYPKMYIYSVPRIDIYIIYIENIYTCKYNYIYPSIHPSALISLYVYHSSLMLSPLLKGVSFHILIGEVFPASGSNFGTLCWDPIRLGTWIALWNLFCSFYLVHSVSFPFVSMIFFIRNICGTT